MKKIVSLAVSLLLAFTLLAVFPSASSGKCISVDASAVNTERDNASAVVFTSDFGASTKTTLEGYEISVDKDGKIVKLGGKKNTDIPQGGFVLSLAMPLKTLVSGVDETYRGIYVPESNTVTFVSEDYSPFKTTALNYTGTNRARAENTFIIYKDKETTGTNTWGYEVTVDASGVIVAVGGNNSAIPKGGFVMSAIGDKKQPLIDAAELGMFVTLDPTSMTVSISYDKESVASSFKLTIENCEKDFENAKKSLGDFDTEKASECIENLKKISSRAEAFAASDDIQNFAANEYAFKKEAARFKNLIIPKVPVEQRCIWLRPAASSSEATVKKTVAEIKKYGFNSVCIEAIFDNTTIFPVPEGSLLEQNPSFGGKDILKNYIEEFHKNDIEVTLWVSCYRIGYKGSANTNRSVAMKKPEWLNISQNGQNFVNNEYGDAFFLNPALPEVKDFILSTYRYLLETYAIDGFQLDYVRYPENSTGNYGYDDYTKKLFKEKYGYSQAPVASGGQGWKEWCELRCSFVTDLVSSVGALIDEVRPDVYFSVDVAPDYTTSNSKMCQDTSKWISNGLVDIVYPMAYGTTDAVIKWTDITVGLCEDKKVHSFIGLRDNGAVTYTEQIVASREHKASGSAFFSYSQYVVNDYVGYIENNVFASPALSPTYNAAKAVSAELSYLSELLSVRAAINDADVNNFSNKCSDLSSKIAEQGITANKDSVSSLLTDGKKLSEKMKGNGNDNIAAAIDKSLHTVDFASANSKDDAKIAYKEAHGIKDESESESSVPEETETKPFEKFFMVFMVVIMTIGIVGLPLYYFLNNRKKRLLKEYKERKNDEPEEPTETDNDGKPEE